MELTLDQLRIIMPRLKHACEYLPYLNKWMRHYGITTPCRVSHFLSQVAHESSQLMRFEENLNYSSQALMRVWPRIFANNLAEVYAGNPEMIANRAYANKGGNGDESSGDGWKYRGRGAIQCTLKSNYAAISKDWKLNLIDNPELLSIPEHAIRSACWYWWKNGLNKLADSGASVKVITQRINRSCLGIEERERFYQKSCSVLS